MSPRRAVTDPLARWADPAFAGATHAEGSIANKGIELFKGKNQMWFELTRAIPLIRDVIYRNIAFEIYISWDVKNKNEFKIESGKS
jgi:hypothetical protein